MGALTKFENHEVNLFNGTVDISIPLHVIQVNDMSVPIVLKYHASGNKVTDRASWVGMGWALEASGQVSRRIMGGHDEGSNGYLNNVIKKASNLSVYDVNDRNYLSMVKGGLKDVEPDIYSYSFVGKSGKFFFDRSSGNTVVAKIPFSPIKIDYTHHQNSLSFDIKDESGNFFQFGKTTRETTTVSNSGVESQNTSSWLLEKILLPNKTDSINFTYSTVSGTIANEGTESLVVSDNVVVVASPQIYYPDPGTTSFKNYNVYVTEKKLNEIIFPGGKVEFIQSTSPREDISGDFRSLSSIKIYKKVDNDPYQVVKEYRFFYSYFINGTDNQSKRLRLDRMELYDKDSKKINSHRFEYNTNVSLPRYNSFSKDYWGYYNGKTNSSLIPRMQIPYNQGSIWVGSNTINGREPDSVYMKAGILDKIHYATGGYSEFKFETNRYSDNGSMKLAGGLRIKEIHTYEKSGATPITRRFEYNVSRSNFQLSNYYFFASQSFRYYAYTSSMGYGLSNSKRVRSFFATPTIDIVPFDGSIVVYPKVTEYIQGGNVKIGKIEYEFRDRTDAMQAASHIGRPTLNSYFYERGQIMKKMEYKLSAGNVFSKVKETEFTYSYYPEKWYNNVGLVVSKNAVNDGIVGFDADIDPNIKQEEASSWLYSNYSISSDDNYPVSKKETYFDNNNSFFVSTIFKYENIGHQQVTKKEVTESDKTRLELYVYPQDYSNTPGAFISGMISNHQIAYPIEKVTAIKKGAAITIVDGVLTKYKEGGRALVDEVFRLETLNPLGLSSFKFSNKPTGTLPDTVTGSAFLADSRYKTAVKYDSYNSAGNPIQYTYIGGLKTSYLWAHKPQLVVAEIKNALQNQVSYTSFEAEEKGGWIYTGTPVASANSKTGRKYYSLDTGNITKSATGATTAAPYKLSFWVRRSSGTGTWTFMNKTENLTTAWQFVERMVTTASVTISGSGIFIDELRLHPSGAQMTTYTHDPQVGVTSITDVRNQTTYYEYDGFGRLKTVKNDDGHIVEHHEYNYSTGN